ncbi:MAG TPA: helix-turn-helix transcriptional regulator [Candidatus Acidoferrales bacterium]|nr:helix-turn-helix transcriptional regulator [Candidatus Acidoferrales bacterium]
MKQMERGSEPEFPIEKEDIRWGAKEVTMERGKFEALLHYLQDVSERLVQAEDELSFQRHDTRKAEKAADVFLGLSASLSETKQAIQKWLDDPKNSIQELSRRTGIPYATCHRIVTERLEDARIETGQLQKLAKAVAGTARLQATTQRSTTESRTREIFAPILGAKLARTFLPESSRIFGVNAKGDLLRKVREVQPNVVLVDVSSSKLTGETLKSLGEFAMKAGITLVFTGVGKTKKKSEPIEKVLAVGDVADTAKYETT